jgi:uncharacterized membrane protein YhaH (DUF805 family)
MKSALNSFKNNTPLQNFFLFCMAIAFLGALFSMNIYAVIAWVCCFVLFIMFCGERDQNKWLRETLNEERKKNLDHLNKSLHQIEQDS